jgi:hypothetical protein
MTERTRPPARYLIMGAFFVTTVIVVAALAVVLAVPQVPGWFGVGPGEDAGGWQALASLGVAIPLVLGIVYAGGLAWLVTACHLFPREEIEAFMKAGPTTRIETWILERFGR